MPANTIDQRPNQIIIKLVQTESAITNQVE